MMMSGRAANEVTFTTSYGCFKHIMSNGGVKVLYKGVFANSVRAVGRYYHRALAATLAAYRERERERELFIREGNRAPTHC